VPLRSGKHGSSHIISIKTAWGEGAIKSIFPLLQKAKTVKIACFTFSSYYLLKHTNNTAEVEVYASNIAVKELVRATFYKVKNLHAKVILIDDHAVIGSANQTYGGLHGNIEFMIITDNKEVVEDVKRFFEHLRRRSSLVSG